MKDQVLSIKQMQKLEKLGVDDSKAKMYWVRQVNGTSINGPINGELFLSLHKGDQFMHSGFMRFETIPTFTLQDMIELMPNNVKYKNKEYYLCFDKKFVGYTDIEENDCVLESDSNILNNTYNVLVWLTENKYI